ncbi:MAG: NAD(P)H-dependent oxidoreductase [Oscillospiraceae bacterium]|nr:NAD(P)H-dependent oxidoreductase [Oscillospiraceae bacterium]
MNILVLNGSPKGSNSITLQTILYLQKKNPAHHFEILHAGAKIRSFEKDFSPALDAISRADVFLFSYPVYTFIAPCQLHRFIELLKASGADLSGKFATQLTTSKHFYDITAHRYIQDNCQDLGLKYIRGLSADMDDLLNAKGQADAEAFFRHVCWSVENDIYEPFPAALPAPIHKTVAVPDICESGRQGDVVIVTDCEPEDTQLQSMIDRFRAVLSRQSRIVNIREYPLKGGCLGCFNCAVTGRCIYKDGFDNYLRNEIQTADSIVYAFTIRDHSMGARFKMYDDRNFCNGHRTVTIGMPVGYLISGNYSQESNLQTIIEARAQVGSNFLAGVAADETDPNGEIDRLAKILVYALDNQYVPPQNFYGIGGMKVFRDLIWLMQGMMKADHKFYKAHGQYDFPQKQWPTMLKMYLVGALLSNEKLKSKMGSAMNEGMLAPYRKVLDSTK